jgi:hypothetical protein
VNLFKTNVNEICDAVETGHMSAKVAANLLRLLREDASCIDLSTYELDFSFVSQLLRNTIIGSIKQALRKVSIIRKVENGNESETKLMHKGHRVALTYDAPLSGAAHHYKIMGYNAGTVFPGESEDFRFYREVPSISQIEDDITAEKLHAKSLVRCQRQGKGWATSNSEK